MEPFTLPTDEALNKAGLIYSQHDKAFAKVSAYVILRGAHERIATVAIKFPQDGAGRLWAYVHVIGLQMQRAHADGFGYDKRTPAVCAAFHKATTETVFDHGPEWAERMETLLGVLKGSLDGHSGYDWTRQLETAGFTVLQAV